MNLFPVPGNNITQEKSSFLTAPWRAWFDWLLSVIQQNVLARDYGSFYDTTTQVTVLYSDVYVIRLGQTFGSNNVNSDGAGKMTVVNAGVFNLEASIQFINNDVVDPQYVFLLLRLNGNDVNYSARQFTLAPNSVFFAQYSFSVTLAAGDYLEMAWAASSVDMELFANPAISDPNIPYTPSVIANLIKIS
jgi:hypothetical protein